MMDVSLHVLLWNSRKDLPELVESLRALTYPHVHIRMLDNGSEDGSAEYIAEHASQWLVAKNVKNVGFAAGHNQLIAYALKHWDPKEYGEKAIMVVNADMMLSPGILEHLVDALANNKALGAVQPKILRAFRATEEGERPERTEVLDSTGLVLGTDWRMEERGAGELDTQQYDDKQDIVGPSGALALFRASALVDVMEGDEVFDETFFSYREDCDLALRLQSRGWKTRFVPEVRAWHYRGMFGAMGRGWLERLRDRARQQPFRSAWSMRNQMFVHIKNFPLRAWRSIPRVIFGEGGRLVYALLFEAKTRALVLRALPNFLKMRTKRRDIRARARVSSEEIMQYAGRGY